MVIFRRLTDSSIQKFIVKKDSVQVFMPAIQGSAEYDAIPAGDVIPTEINIKDKIEELRKQL